MNDAVQVEKSVEPLKLNVQRRLEFIDFRLLWDGRFNRKDLSDTFQISSQQASADIAAYEQRAPHNLRYDNAVKAYLRTETFEPIFMRDLSDRYLLQLVGIQSGWIAVEDTWFQNLPPSEVVALKRRKTDSQLLQRVLDAIREKMEMEVEYRSINSAKNERRWIAPHALAYSAGRWYIRAWSRERNDFRDFNLNRICSTFELRPISIDTTLDYEWNNYIDLRLVANPELPDETRKAVEAEYNMSDGCIIANVRLSLVFYFMNEYNLDVEPGKLNPRKQQLVLLNRSEIETARDVARKMSENALKRAMPV